MIRPTSSCPTLLRIGVSVMGGIGLMSVLFADGLDDLVLAKMKADHVPGVAVAVIGKDNRADVRSYGVANLESNQPFTANTVFRIASLSKQFCAYATKRLEIKGKLSLDDRLSKYFPGVPLEFGAVTLREIVGHRSGIADPGRLFEYGREYEPSEYVKLLSALPLTEKPGSTYRYNNHAYSLLGLVVGKADGTSLAEVVQSEVFEKVGMKDTRYYRMEDVIPGRADAYEWVKDHFERRFSVRPKVYEGSGGILSTMNDMVKYELALRGNGVLDRSVLDWQWTPVYGGDQGYGGGWHIDKRPTVNRLVHTGTSFGFSSYFLRDLNSGVTIILFRNADEGDKVDWAESIFQWAIARASRFR